MKTIKFLTVLLLVIGVFTFTSCVEDDPEPIVETHDDAYVDVILKKVMTPDGISRVRSSLYNSSIWSIQ